ncbi:IS30 family transposase [Patescibacteria group bacterium]|nr:IS30 family transposase [Patescibacteria group bacterium]
MKKRKKFSRLSKSERHEISILKQKKYSLREIARTLKRSVSTISEEIRLNSLKNRYDPIKAHHKAYVRRKYSKYQPMKIIKNNDLRKLIDSMLYDDQSPPNIAGRIARHEKNLPLISKDSIYRYIKSVYGRKIEAYLQKKKARRRRRRTKDQKLKDRTFINKRPQFINKRQRIGHAEADFIVSGKASKGILLVVADRKIRATFLEKITKITINNVHKSFVKIKQRFPEMKTITMDNDILFQKHKDLEKIINVKIYFCHPYHSWEKGTVENINKYIRRDIPKASNISQCFRHFIEKIEKKLNRRSLKCLDYLTPKECLDRKRNKQKKR